MIEKLHALIGDIPIVMMTTKRADGRLVTRPMMTQSSDGTCDLWFLVGEDADVVAELAADPHVSLAYVKDEAWISVSGTARLVREGWVRIEVDVDAAEHFDGVTTSLLDEAPVFTAGLFGTNRGTDRDDDERPRFLA